MRKYLRQGDIIGLVLILLTSGYYDPVGGLSPGARFFTPALPFLAVGLPCAFRRWRTAMKPRTRRSRSSRCCGNPLPRRE